MSEISEYNKKAIIVLNPEAVEPYVPFSFGVLKGRVILANIGVIEEFIKSKEKILDITPEINETKKRFLLTKYKAILIIKHLPAIEAFVEKESMQENKRASTRRENWQYAHSFNPFESNSKNKDKI